MARGSAEAEMAREMRESGMSLRAIGAEFGVTCTTIKQWLMTDEEYEGLMRRNAERRRERRSERALAGDGAPSYHRSDKVLLTDEDRERLRLIRAALRMGATPELIDRRMHWRPGETERQLEGERMARRTRAVRV